jgi:hypothetical protein
MRLRDEVIASYLDDEWRTPPAVHRLLGDRGTVADIVSALERLARAGKIEAKHEAMMVPKFRDKSGPPVLCIDFYRKLQRRTPQHGGEGTGSRRRRTEDARSGARHAGDRENNRSSGTARRARSAAPAPHERAAGIPRRSGRPAEGEGKMTMRLHERIHAMRQRRRRLPLRDRLRSRRRLVELGLRAKGK